MESRCLSVVLLAVLIAWPAAGIPPQHANSGRAGDPEIPHRGPRQARLWLAGAESGTAQSSGQEPIAPTEISADLGGCSALITVTGSNDKPVFNAKVSTRIRYGLFGTKKLDLEVYSSASGQVKVIGLPESPKRPIIFQISKGEKFQTVEFKPDSTCNATYNVRLK